ncbi:MAG TPA: type II secretion system protein N [Rudaea sp.]|nr:type II secretion system protein N [Rudaea sp.]
MLNSTSNADALRLSRLGALAVSAAAAATCVWLLVRLVWLLLPHVDVVLAPAPPVSSEPAAAAQSIAKWHLFGNPQSVPVVLARNAPATTLKLMLRGTFALADPKQGIAIVADEQGAEHAYRVGDDVGGGAKLTEVYPDHVVLSHEGAAETLRLPRPEEHVPEMPDRNRQNLAGTSGKAASVPPTFVPPQMAHGALDWSAAQKRLQIDPQELAKQVHVEFVFESGKIAGARLSGGGKIGELMNRAGLKPDDVVTAVNGTPLAGLSDPQRFRDNLKDAQNLQVTVLRGGKPATLTVNLR